MEAAVFNSDPMLHLLTEALRRGPGSPEWHRAVSDLRDVATPEADEYRLLIAARERLESGRAYREVRAGPAFTRELFGRIDAGPATPPRLSIGLIVRLVCLLLLVGVIGMVVLSLTQAAPRGAAQQLSGRLFVTSLKNWTFASMPTDLRAMGPLPLEARGGVLRAGGRDTASPMVGLLVWETPIDLVAGTCLEMRIDYEPGPTAMQLVLLKDFGASQATGLSGLEIAMICDKRGVTLSTPAGFVATRPLSKGTHVLRLKVAGEAAVAEVDGTPIWSDTSQLRTRGFAAIRIVRDGKAGGGGVQSLRVLAP